MTPEETMLIEIIRKSKNPEKMLIKAADLLLAALQKLEAEQ